MVGGQMNCVTAFATSLIWVRLCANEGTLLNWNTAHSLCAACLVANKVAAMHSPRPEVIWTHWRRRFTRPHTTNYIAFTFTFNDKFIKCMFLAWMEYTRNTKQTGKVTKFTDNDLKKKNARQMYGECEHTVAESECSSCCWLCHNFLFNLPK